MIADNANNKILQCKFHKEHIMQMHPPPHVLRPENKGVISRILRPRGTATAQPHRALLFHRITASKNQLALMTTLSPRLQCPLT